MLLSDEKASHLSHLILDHLKKPANARLQADEPVVLREIKRVLAAELKVEQEVEAAVRRRLASYARPLAEGSAEWETLYRKTGASPEAGGAPGGAAGPEPAAGKPDDVVDAEYTVKH